MLLDALGMRRPAMAMLDCVGEMGRRCRSATAAQRPGVSRNADSPAAISYILSAWAYERHRRLVAGERMPAHFRPNISGGPARFDESIGALAKGGVERCPPRKSDLVGSGDSAELSSGCSQCGLAADARHGGRGARRLRFGQDDGT